jgi:uncharacterized protein with ParB-like and HNH nuclease domain
MKAHDSYLTSFLKLSDAIFNIPVYQRNYDWETDDCTQLFQDIEMIAITGKDHFIGSIVYISIGTATEPYYNIIDGQQRITSVMLFLKALHDSTDDSGFQKKVRHGFLINIGLDDEPKMKLKQVESDRSVYEQLILQNKFNENAFSEAEKNSNVYKNYCCFRELINHSDVPLQDLYNAVFKLEIIDTRLTTEDPQEVFESMNSTGRSLTNTDLLRNYLLMDLQQTEQEKLYKQYWSKIEKNVGQKQMDMYMVHYLIMKRKSDSINIRRRSAKINKTTLYECYRIYFPAENKKNGGTQRLLEDMYKYSVIYGKLFSGKNKTALEKAITEVMLDLSAEPVAIFLMYLLHEQEAIGVTDDEMTDAVKACVSYVFRVRIFKGSVSPQFFALAIQSFEKGETSKPFVDRIWDALVTGSGSYRFPRDREFQDAFENKNMYLEFKPPMLRYMLYKYERARTKEIVDPESATIEHILPQDTKEWQRHLTDIHDYEYRDLMHRIGNLTLTKMNAEASNSSFADKKKKVYEKSGYAITRELATRNDWSSKEIKARSAAMAKEALELWPLPDRYNQESGTTLEFTSMNEDTEELFNRFRELVRSYDASIYEEPKKMYINFLRNKKVVCSLVPFQESIKVTFACKKEELTQKSPWGGENHSSIETTDTIGLEDISNKGHWGVGSCRMTIHNEGDIWTALEYIQQIIGV